MSDYQHILVASDFSASSEAALARAVDMARKYGARLTVFHSCEAPAYGYTPGVPPLDLLTSVQTAAQSELDRTMESVRQQLPDARGLLALGDPQHEILRAIDDQGVDLVVMGTHGRRGVQHAFLGSVAERVVRCSKVPVLTVHAEKRAA